MLCYAAAGCVLIEKSMKVVLVVTSEKTGSTKRLSYMSKVSIMICQSDIIGS